MAGRKVTPKRRTARKADKLAGRQSLADRLRQRRRALEGGDATGGSSMRRKPKPRTL